jgi:hypothetical protein
MKNSQTLSRHILATVLAGVVGQNPENAGSMAGAESEQGASARAATTTMIRMTIGGEEIAATLFDNPSAVDFASMLPLTLILNDYATTEKISGLPRGLTTRGAPLGIDPSIGDITYYAPWGNLAVFYKDFGYSKGLVRLGVINSGVEALSRPGPLKVTIELVSRGSR